MSSKPLIGCPHCDARFRAKSDAIIGRKTKCPKCQKPFVAAECDEWDALESPEEVESRLPSRRKKSAPQRKPMSARKRRALIRWGIIGSLVVASLGVVIFVDWGGILKSTGLFVDTPEKLVAQLQSCRSRSKGLIGLEEIDSRSVSQLESAAEEMRGIFLRLSRLAPLTDQVYDDLEKRFPDAFTPSDGGGDDYRKLFNDIFSSGGRGRSNLQAQREDWQVRSRLGISRDRDYTVEKSEAAYDNQGRYIGQRQTIKVHSKSETDARRKKEEAAADNRRKFSKSKGDLRINDESASMALRFGLHSIPAPKNKGEEEAADVVEIIRGLNRRLAPLRSTMELQQIVPEFEAAVDHLKKYQRLNNSAQDPNSVERLQAAGQYYPFAISSIMQMNRLIDQIEDRIEPSIAFRMVLLRLKESLPEQSLVHHLNPKKTSDAPVVDFAKTGLATATRGQRGGIESPTATTNPAETPGARPSPQSDGVIQRYIDKHGKDQVLFVKLTGRVLSQDERRGTTSTICNVTNSNTDTLIYSFNNEVIVGVVYSGSVEEIAKKITFAEVVSVDDESRMIVVKFPLVHVTRPNP